MIIMTIFVIKKGRNSYYFTGKIKSKIMFIKIELLSCIEKIQLEVKCENKSKKNLINLKDSISISLKPFNPFTKEDKIFFDMKLDEKQSLLEILIG